MFALPPHIRVRCATIRPVGSLTRRGLIAGGLPLLGAGGALLHASGARGHSGQMTPAANGHDHGGHANFRGNVAVDHARNGFDPHEIVRDFDWGTTTRMANGRVVREWELTRARQGDRGHAGRHVRRLDLQRADPGADAARPRGRAAADHVRQRLRAPAHDPLPRHPPVVDGRRAGLGAGRSSRARAPSTSSRRCPPGCTSTTATSGRWPSTSPRASTARSSSTRRTGARTRTRW